MRDSTPQSGQRPARANGKVTPLRKTNGVASPAPVAVDVDEAAERAWIEHVLVRHRDVDEWLGRLGVEVVDDHFANPDNRAIFRAWNELRGEGKRATINAVAARLNDAGHQHAATFVARSSAGAGERLLMLSEDTFIGTTTNLDVARARRAKIAMLTRHVEALRSGDAHDGWQTELAEELTRISNAKPRPTLVDRALGLGHTGPRLKTNFGTLDLATRGGFPTNRRLFLVGAPGAAKTAMALVLAHRWAIAGHFVAVHAADEEANALLVRLGQMEGFDRDALEAGRADIKERLAERLSSHFGRLLLIDQDADGLDLDDTADLLVRAAKGAPAVLVIDSIQTVRIRNAPLARSRREELDEIVRRIKALSARGLLIVATSEMNRGAYRSKSAGENAEDIASAAETRAIEYAATTMLTLRSVKDHGDLVDVTMPKNRLGKRLDFRVQLDAARATMGEVAVEDAPSSTPTSGSGSDIKNAVLAIVRGEPQDSSNAICKKVRFGRNAVLKAIGDLFIEGHLVKLGGQIHASPAT